MGCMWPSRKPGTHGLKKLWGIKILRTYSCGA